MSWLPNLQWNRGQQNPSGTQPSTPNTPSGSQHPSQQNANGVPQNSQVAANNGNPNGQGSGAPANPMDAFSGFFQSQQGNGGQSGQPQATSGQPTAPAYEGFIAPWDMNTVQQRASQLDFTRGMNPETVQKALGGDPQAFMDAMNHVARQAFIGSTQAAHGFADRATKTGLERMNSGLDDRLRDYGVRNQNVGNNPMYNHPAVKPMVDALKFQIASSDPKLSPEQVAQKVDEYFQSFGSTFVAQHQDTQANQAQKGEPDWLAQFNLAPTQGR